MEAPRTIRAGTIRAQWYFVALVTAAIATSGQADLAGSDFSDRAGYSAQQPAVLVAAFCVSDTVCPVVCGRWPVAGCPGHAKRIHPDHAVVVRRLRSAWAGHELRGS